MSDTPSGLPADPSSVTSTIVQNQKTLGWLADALTRYERGMNSTGPFVKRLDGKPVSASGQIFGPAYHSAAMVGFRHDIESVDGFQELRTFTLREWGEQLTAASCHRLIGELLRRFPEMSAPQVEGITVREAVDLLSSVAKGEEPSKGREDDPTVSNLYRLVDTCDALALVPHRWRELTPLDPNGYDEGMREQGEIWHAVFGGNGVAGLVQRASAELRGEVETTAIIREMGNWLERWGRAFRPFAPLGDRDSTMREQAALPVEWWLQRHRLMEALTRLGVMVPEDLMTRPAFNEQWNRRELVTHCDLMNWLVRSRPAVQVPNARLPSLERQADAPHAAVGVEKTEGSKTASNAGTENSKGGKPGVKGKNVNARMAAMLLSDPMKTEWTARQWAENLQCGDGTVKETTTWKQTIKTARALQQAGRMQRPKRGR